MSVPRVLICGAGAEEIRSLLEERTRVPLRYLVIEEANRLLEILPRPDLSVVIVRGDMARDPLFRRWRKTRLADLPMVHIGPAKEGRFAEDGDGVAWTHVPESDLAALPYIVELACAPIGRSGAAHHRPAPASGEEGGHAIARPILGRSRGIQNVLESARKVLNVNSSLLILGESGTGKELVASMVHHESVRLGRPFVKVNCAAIPETLLESELFGIEKNVATSVDMRIGKFELAHGGTIFLDEIADMSLLTQSKVLRILQEREFERVGGSRPIRVKVRVIAATNKDPEGEIAAKRFREDLYYRLNVITIRIPPLRERLEDIEPLADHFVSYYCRENGLPRKRVSKSALDALARYSWPGNVRELENAIERAVVIGEGNLVRREDLPPTVLKAIRPAEGGAEDPFSLRGRVRDYEKSVLVGALDETDWVQAKAARRLGISERSMWHLFKKYGLEDLRRRERARRRDGD
ncbi:MAG: sigma-54 dependent transcriptional regulator [Candidatus Eisenbacteria bacterium]